MVRPTESDVLWAGSVAWFTLLQVGWMAAILFSPLPLAEGKALVRRFLKVCPIGSFCFVWLGDGHRNYRLEGRAVEEQTIVVTKWPGNKNVERAKP